MMSSQEYHSQFTTGGASWSFALTVAFAVHNVLGGAVMNNTENLTMHCKVKDYATWRRSYDSSEGMRQSAGIMNGRVFRSVNDPNEIVVIEDVTDETKALAWLNSDQLKTGMKNSGVLGTPTARFAH
jgi:hypothetical protein